MPRVSAVLKFGQLMKCEFCGIVFKRRQQKKFCSQPCRMKAMHLAVRKYPTKYCVTCKTELSRRHIKTATVCSRECFKVYAKENLRGKNSPIYKGIAYSAGGGYLRIYDPNSSRRHTSVHRLVMERKLGRKLGRHEVVHHINGNKTDNRLSNLELMTVSEHTKHHAEELLRKRWNKPTLKLKANHER